MCEPHLLIISYMANQIKVYQPNLASPKTPLSEARKIQITQPSSILVKGSDR
jgi:hypothetical protein